MSLINLFLENNNITFKVDKSLIITGVSSFIKNSEYGELIIGEKVDIMMANLLYSKKFENKGFSKAVIEFITNTFETKESFYDIIVVTNDISNSAYYYSFQMSLDIIVENDEESVLFKITELKQKDAKNQEYEDIFEAFQIYFPVISKFKSVGYFVLDYARDNGVLYANDAFNDLLKLKIKGNAFAFGEQKLLTNEDKLNEIISGINLIRDRQLDKYSTEFFQHQKWLKVEMIAIKEELDGSIREIGGILYDVTDYRLHEDTQYMKSIYEMAIASGGIGIFYYDRDKMPLYKFEANDIYVDMIGLTPTESKQYDLREFESTVQDPDFEIGADSNIKNKVLNLVQGNIDGTNDDIIKIQNKKTGEFKYLLSSSKIDQRFNDGTPRKFGGICIDITERILQEQYQIAFAYIDELTGLKNNRKLMKDMIEQKAGVGFFFDLDNFKKINDNYGHMKGNEALEIFADALKTVGKYFNSDFVYRMYGDEFFVFVPNGNEDTIQKLEPLLKETLTKKLKNSKCVVNLETSIGHAYFDQNKDIDDFIKEADYAMYANKIKKKRTNKNTAR